MVFVCVLLCTLCHDVTNFPSHLLNSRPSQIGDNDIGRNCHVQHESVKIRGATFVDFKRPESWVFDDGVMHWGDNEVLKQGGFGALHPNIKYTHIAQ